MQNQNNQQPPNEATQSYDKKGAKDQAEVGADRGSEEAQVANRKPGKPDQQDDLETQTENEMAKGGQGA